MYFTEINSFPKETVCKHILCLTCPFSNLLMLVEESLSHLLPVSPNSPKIQRKTLASVPALDFLPV